MKISLQTEAGQEIAAESENESQYFKHLLMNKDKKAMIITARVHPGET